MNRETFKMSEIKNEDIYCLFGGEDVYSDNHNEILEFEWIDEEIGYTDYGKGYSNKSLIFKRCSDNKYFKVAFTAYSDGVYESLENLKAVEVFPKQVITYIYE